MKEFDVFPKPPVVLEIAGESLELSPLRVGELPPLLAAIRPLAHRLTETPDWVGLLAEHGDAVIDGLAIVSRRPRAWIAGLGLDDLVRLAGAVLEVNADFFAQRVGPEVARVAERLEARLQTATGRAPSSA